MAEEKRRSKRQSQAPIMDEGMWECSMCTYKNPPEFFKCEICECRKGTSTRKPRLNPQLIAQQAAQQVFIPPTTKKDRRERRADRRDREKDSLDSADVSYEDDASSEPAPADEPREATPPPPPPPPPPAPAPPLRKEPSTSKERPEKEPHTSKCHKKKPPRLKNIDRSSGQSMEVTVRDVTVTITDYKPLRKERSSAAAVADKSHSGGAAAQDNKDSGAPGSDKHTPTKEPATNGEVKANS